MQLDNRQAWPSELLSSTQRHAGEGCQYLSNSRVAFRGYGVAEHFQVWSNNVWRVDINRTDAGHSKAIMSFIC